MSSLNISLARGLSAESLLQEEGFRWEWSTLHGECPWASAFQGPGYCVTWYQVYRNQFEPLFVLSRDRDGRLNGLMPLAIALEDGAIVVAGSEQAEYQGWVCLPALGDLFPWHAFQAVRREFPRAVLTFRYLPPETPLDWTSDSEARRICWLKRLRRPLWRFEHGDNIADTLRKKSNRSRLNRLEKAGPLQFKRITDPEELEQLFDTIIRSYDFRQAVAHGSAPFRDDDRKRPFHLALMRTPGLLHATVLKAGDHLAAAHLGLCGAREVQLGIIAHNPWLASHSPGKFHILFLAQMLLEEGFEQLDLTAGGDAYKERFANSFDAVHLLSVHPTVGQQRMKTIRESAKETAKTMLRAIRVEPRKLKSLRRRLAGVHPLRLSAGLAASAGRWIHRRREFRIYSLPTASVMDLDPPHDIRRDDLDDLLRYRPSDTWWLPPQQFLLEAANRIDNGHHVYTRVVNGRLVHYGWLIERPSNSVISGADQASSIPPDSAWLHDFHSLPCVDHRDACTLSMHKMLCDVARTARVEMAYVSMPANDRPCQYAVEKLGFVYRSSRFEDVWFGRART